MTRAALVGVLAGSCGVFAVATSAEVVGVDSAGASADAPFACCCASSFGFGDDDAAGRLAELEGAASAALVVVATVGAIVVGVFGAASPLVAAFADLSVATTIDAASSLAPAAAMAPLLLRVVRTVELAVADSMPDARRPLSPAIDAKATREPLASRDGDDDNDDDVDDEENRSDTRSCVKCQPHEQRAAASDGHSNTAGQSLSHARALALLPPP